MSTETTVVGTVRGTVSIETTVVQNSHRDGVHRNNQGTVTETVPIETAAENNYSSKTVHLATRSHSTSLFPQFLGSLVGIRVTKTESTETADNSSNS